MGTLYLHELIVADEVFIGEDLVDGDGGDPVVTCEGERGAEGEGQEQRQP